LPAAVEVPHLVVVPVAVKVIEEKYFVIASQKRTGNGFGERDQPIDHSLRIGPAIDIIPDKHEVIVFSGGELFQKGIERFYTPMYIPDRNEAHLSDHKMA